MDGRGITRKPATGMPINSGLKNPNYGKHASQVRDGLNTVRDFEVLISLGFKIRKPKKHVNAIFQDPISRTL
jgi:hypothetical protein